MRVSQIEQTSPAMSTVHLDNQEILTLPTDLINRLSAGSDVAAKICKQPEAQAQKKAHSLTCLLHGTVYFCDAKYICISCGGLLCRLLTNQNMPCQLGDDVYVQVQTLRSSKRRRD